LPHRHRECRAESPARPAPRRHAAPGCPAGASPGGTRLSWRRACALPRSGPAKGPSSKYQVTRKGFFHLALVTCHLLLRSQRLLVQFFVPLHRLLPAEVLRHASLLDLDVARLVGE